MNTGAKELHSILEELEALKLPHMASELEKLYKQLDAFQWRFKINSEYLYAKVMDKTEDGYCGAGHFSAFHIHCL